MMAWHDIFRAGKTILHGVHGWALGIIGMALGLALYATIQGK
jgi:hypothetical protein